MKVEPETAETSDGSQPSGFDLGVLFVHGIGEQPQGDTLLRFAEPVLDWLDRWVRREGRDDGNVRIETAALQMPDASSAPPHSIVSIDGGRPAEAQADASSSERSRWLLAESWWADELRRPRFARLALWMLTVGTWMIFSHAGRSFQLRPKDWAAKLRAVPVFLASFFVASFVQIVVAFLALLALLPIPALRRGLSGVLLTLTGTLGDSYVINASPLQRAAAVRRVRENLRWLQGMQCRKIVVVAHSQGAAVAHEAVRDPAPAEVERLITVGSGQAKLEELRLMERRRPGLLVASALILPLLVFVAAIWRTLNAVLSDDSAVFSMVFTAVVFLGIVAYLAFTGLEFYRERLAALSLKTVRPSLIWRDFYASADPVSNGPLHSSATPIEGVRSYRVLNYQSVLRDHTTYFQSRDDFLPRLVFQLAASARLPLISLQDFRRIFRARERRRRRVRWLRVFYWITLAGLGLTFVGLAEELPALGERYVLAPLNALPLVGAIAGLLEGFESFVQALASGLVTAGSSPAPPIGLSVIGALVPCALFLSWHYLITTSLWKAYDAVEVRGLFRPSATGSGDRAFLFIILLYAALQPFALAVITLFTPTLGGALSTLGYMNLLGFIATFTIAILAGVLVRVYQVFSTLKRLLMEAYRFVADFWTHRVRSSDAPRR